MLEVQTHFICYSCAEVPEDGSPPKGHLVFAAPPSGIDPADKVATAECPHCGRVCRELPIERNRRLAQAEGRLATLDKEARARTEKAAAAAVWTTGRYSKTAIGPACREVDDKRCQGCEYFEADDWKRSLCRPADKCLREENRWLRVIHAYATNNPIAMRDVFAELGAHAVTMLARMVEEVEMGLLTIQQPVPGSTLTIERDGEEEELVGTGTRTEVHPLIPEIVKLIKVLGVDPASWRLTTQAAGVGAREDAETTAAKLQGARDVLDLLRDPTTPRELAELIAESAHFLAGAVKDKDGDGPNP